MSLKRRNYIAVALMVLAAVLWSWGQNALDGDTESINPSTAVTVPVAGTMVAPTGEGTTGGWTPSTTPDAPQSSGIAPSRALGLMLSLAAVLIGAVAIFGLVQRNPICGPDGVCLMLAFLTAAAYFTQRLEYLLWSSTAAALEFASKAVCMFVVLVGIRELFGWLWSRFALSWCLIGRTVRRRKLPQTALLTFVAWIFLTLTAALFFSVVSAWSQLLLISFIGTAAAAGFGIVCLWRYGADLAHFQEQLNKYKAGLPITVGDGAFSQTEAQLLLVQAQHEEAVNRAVTSERFKVELIANVSHDLRTPLTAILGYSELLQKENLSTAGQEHLHALHQKAGYMNELVESLFELTKVSSGVLESKKEKIDLIRLLEQTIGLFDDQLAKAELSVRRSYAALSIPVITDGARMHQVFANLLGNAIKYALAGTRIYLEVKETADSHLIRIVNTASYEMDFEPNEIMQRFARGDKARSTKGSGLGLAIAQTYTESVGGSFRVVVDGDQFNAIVELPKTERNL